MKIIIACDHLGIEFKQNLINYLKKNQVEVEEINKTNEEYDDYPDFAFEVCKKVLTENALGILICGNGIGMSIAANKVKGIRAARVVNIDDVFKAKNHNGANVITMGANIDFNLACQMVDTFVGTKSPTEERYLRRITKIKNYEDNNEL